MNQPTDTRLLTEQVQGNCNISDARHGADYGLCTYLLKMREFYRWEKRLGFDVELPKADVGSWLQAREALWDRLENESYRPLTLGGEVFDPFDVAAVNRRLRPHGLVYSAGYGVKNKPLFCLARLERLEQPSDGFSVVVAGEELARDLSAPAGMALEGQLFVRRESFRRLIWEKLENWRWSRPDNALGRAFACYDFEGDLLAALERMVDDQLEIVLQHERGEQLVGRQLGERWSEMVSALAFTPAELQARAVRDHWADCLVTLPVLIDRGEPAAIHFYMGNLDGMRKSLFPALALAYDEWLAGGGLEGFRRLVKRGVSHWAGLAEAMLELFDDGQGAERIAQFVAGRAL